MTAWAIDLDGVVWRGSETVPGAPEAIDHLRAAGSPIAFVTNSALRTPAQVGEKLARHGIPDAADLVVTSAMAAASLIEPGERVVVVGSDGLTGAVADRGAEVVPTGPADCVLVGLSHTFGYDDITRAMHAIGDGARFIASNADATFSRCRTVPPWGRFDRGGRRHRLGNRADRRRQTTRDHRDVRNESGLAATGSWLATVPKPTACSRSPSAIGSVSFLTGVVGPDDLPVDPEPDHIATDLAALVEAISAG